MHSIWKGAISFGLVNIPVALYPAVRKEDLKFRLLRKKDLSPVNYKRVAETDGAEVPWEETVKGYEYQPGQFVPMEPEDFKQADADASQSIQIVDFVKLDEIDPIYFDKPYYLEPQKGAQRAYALLREVMLESGTIGIAKVVIRTKQHLAALKPRGTFLILELMHFAEEVLEPAELKTPGDVQPARQELDLAKALVGKMTTQWDPARYTDDYRSTLLQAIERKVKEGQKPGKGSKPAPAPPANVVNMLEMLEKSLSETDTAKRAQKKKAPPPRKAAA